MTPAGLPPPVQPWPPLRITQKRPWIRVRDIALTLCAWVALAWILRGLVSLVYDFLRAPIFELTKPVMPDAARFWQLLSVLAALAAALMASLALWALKERRRLAAVMTTVAPAPLATAEHAARFQLAAASVVAAQSLQIIDVQFREDGSVASFDGRKPNGAELREQARA